MEKVKAVIREIGEQAKAYPLVFVAMWFAALFLYYAHRWAVLKAGGGL